jgi:acyl carrier protein
MTQAQEQILVALGEVATEVTNSASGQIDMDTSLAADLHVDSLALAEFGVAVQDKFGIELTDNQVSRFVTIGDVVDAIVRTGAS